MSSTDHVVVVGGGFGGVACAKRLAKKGVRVTLIDRNTYHQFQPLLYQVATAQLAPGDVMRPLRGLFRKHPSVDVKAAEVVAIDPATRTVTAAGGETFTGDHLVIAMGARPEFFGTAGAEEHAFPLYAATDAVRLRDRVLELYEEADLEPGRIDEGALNFVVVGGGPTGVETAGALADLVRDVMPQRYNDLAVDRTTITLVDHGSNLLAPFSDKAHAYAAQVLTDRGVTLRMGTGVTEIGPGHVALSDGDTIRTRCVVWGGGLHARAFEGIERFPVGRGGRITVGPDHGVEQHPGVYAVGDIAAAPGADGTPLPQLGSVALQAGESVADSILAAMAGKRPPVFDYHDKGIMAMIGRNAAIAELGKHHHELHGSVAFSAWLGVHAWLMSGARSRIDAFISWGWDEASRNRGPGFVEDPDRVRIDWDDDGDDTTDDDTPAEEAAT